MLEHLAVHRLYIYLLNLKKGLMCFKCGLGVHIYLKSPHLLGRSKHRFVRQFTDEKVGFSIRF